MMRKFLAKIVAFMMPIAVAVFMLSNKGEIIPFSGSISFDSTIYELHKRGKIQIDNLAIGSSMTLNDLASGIIAPSLDGETYYNVSSWGQAINEDYEMLKVLVPIYAPKRVFIVSFCGDFGNSSIKSSSDVASYLRGGKGVSMFLMTKYKIERQFLNFDAEYEASKLDTCSYSSLRFDEWGGVSLNVYGENISEKRWDDTSHFAFDEDNESYDSLERICHYLRSENVELVFVFPPARKSFYAGNYDDVQKHISHVRDIVEGYNHIFMNELDYSEYPDSLFCDACHLNARGATHFTSNIVRQLDSLSNL